MILATCHYQFIHHHNLNLNQDLQSRKSLWVILCRSAVQKRKLFKLSCLRSEDVLSTTIFINSEMINSGVVAFICFLHSRITWRFEVVLWLSEIVHVTFWWQVERSLSEPGSSITSNIWSLFGLCHFVCEAYLLQCLWKLTHISTCWTTIFTWMQDEGFILKFGA